MIWLYILMYLFLLKVLFPFRLLQNIEQTPLCSRVGPCVLSVLNMMAFSVLNSQTIPLLTHSPLVTINSCSKSGKSS